MKIKQCSWENLLIKVIACTCYMHITLQCSVHGAHDVSKHDHAQEEGLLDFPNSEESWIDSLQHLV